MKMYARMHAFISRVSTALVVSLYELIDTSPACSVFPRKVQAHAYLAIHTRLLLFVEEVDERRSSLVNANFLLRRSPLSGPWSPIVSFSLC